PLLVDHSYIHDDLIDESRSVGGTQPQQGGGGSGGGSGSGSGTIAPNVDSSYIEKYINDIKDQFKPLFSGIDLIKIKEVPEKEGIIFKHINYMITHDLKIGGTSSGTKKVIRRYSDFVWYVKLFLNKANFYESLYVLLTIFI
ncbi:sorting nexin MVP1, partial [Candida albicans P78048]